MMIESGARNSHLIRKFTHADGINPGFINHLNGRIEQALAQVAVMIITVVIHVFLRAHNAVGISVACNLPAYLDSVKIKAHDPTILTVSSYNIYRS